jgi:hypothetical protein
MIALLLLGAWISHPDHTLRSGPLPLFRKEFAIDRTLKRATAQIAGVGFHELHINGAKAGDHVLAPAWSNYRATVYYETFDVTPMLHPGSNALGVMLGNGFYNVAGGRYTKYTGSFGHPRLWMQLHLEYADGAATDIATDATWRVAEGPITFSCIYGGEDYDARREFEGWDSPGFDDSKWARASTNEAPGGVMREQTSPPVKVQQTFETVKITEPKPGVFVYDLGQNFAGWPAIEARGNAGATVKMIPGELLDQNGLVSQRSSGGPVSFSYTLAGRGVERWEPRFTYSGFRYVQIEGLKPLKATGRFVHLDAPRVGSFESSNETLNRIHKLIDAAVRSNLQHSLTDCPHREKLGWLEQFNLMGPSLLYNWDLRTFLPKVARDMREAQLNDGLVPDIAPEYVTFKGGFRDSPEWGASGVLLPWLAWKWYGDRTILEDSYTSMKAYVRYLDTQSSDGLLSYGLGDWYDIGPKPPGYSQLTPMGLTATASYLQCLRAMAETARVLDDAPSMRFYEGKFDVVRQAFQRAFYKNGIYSTGSQTSLAMPLALDIAPRADRAALVGKLVAGIRSLGNHTTAGDVGYTYVIRALLEAGRSDVIFDMATQTTPPSYAAQLSAGATTLTEAWDANPNSSQNHLMLGHIEQWFYAGLAGIRPDGPNRIVFQPEPVGDLKWVKASWNSVHGPVSVDWRKEGAAFHSIIGIPPGITAELRLPGQAPRTVGPGRYEQ